MKRTHTDEDKVTSDNHVVARLTVCRKLLRSILENMKLVSDHCVLQFTPESLCVTSQCDSLTLAEMGTFPPDFFEAYSCEEPRDVSVHCGSWLTLLKYYDETLAKDGKVGIVVSEGGAMIEHTFFDDGGRQCGTQSMPTEGEADSDFLFTFADEAVEAVVVAAEWRKHMDKLSGIAEEITFVANAETIELFHSHKVRGSGCRTLTVGSELSALRVSTKVEEDNKGDKDGDKGNNKEGDNDVQVEPLTVRHSHKMEKLKKAAHAFGVKELVLRFVPAGPLEQHAILGVTGRLCLFVCPQFVE